MAKKKRRVAIRPDQIQHRPPTTELTEAQLTRLGMAYWLVGNLICPTLEEWELGFMRDAPEYVDKEVNWWVRAGIICRESVIKHPEHTMNEYLTALLDVSIGKKPEPKTGTIVLAMNKYLISHASDLVEKWFAAYRQAKKEAERGSDPH